MEDDSVHATKWTILIQCGTAAFSGLVGSAGFTCEGLGWVGLVASTRRYGVLLGIWSKLGEAGGEWCGLAPACLLISREICRGVIAILFLGWWRDDVALRCGGGGVGTGVGVGVRAGWIVYYERLVDDTINSWFDSRLNSTVLIVSLHLYSYCSIIYPKGVYL